MTAFASVWDLVMKLDASGILRAMLLLEGAQQAISVTMHQGRSGFQWDAHAFEVFVSSAQKVRDEADALHLRFTSQKATRLLSFLSSVAAQQSQYLFDPEQAENFCILVKDVSGRLQDELDAAFAYLVHQADTHFYEDGAGWVGPAALEKFPEIAFDIEEGGKCFALERYTACVFHLMRAAEAVALAMAVALGAPTTEGNGKTMAFGKLVNSLHDFVKGKAEHGEKREAWSSAYMLLLHVNRGYRVPVSHPGAKYTEEEARRIMNAVRGFIPALAELL